MSYALTFDKRKRFAEQTKSANFRRLLNVCHNQLFIALLAFLAIAFVVFFVVVVAFGPALYSSL